MGRRSKDFLLLALAVVALVVAVSTFRHKPASTTASPAGATAAKPKQTAKAPDKEPAKGTAPGGLTSPSGATRNPFEGPGTAAAPAPVDELKEPAAAAAQAPKPPEGRSEPAPTPAVVPQPTPAKPATPAAAPGKAKASTLTLNGILAGRQTIALIRDGSQRYYVKVGDRVGDRYRVQSIAQKQVVLSGSEGKVILRMGGRQ